MTRTVTRATTTISSTPARMMAAQTVANEISEAAHECGGDGKAARARGSDGKPSAPAYTMARPPTNADMMIKLPVPAEAIVGRARPYMQ